MKNYLKVISVLLVCFSLICVGGTVTARLIPQEDAQRIGEQYYYSEDYAGRMFKVCDIQHDTETGSIRFKEALSLEGTAPAIPDLVYLIDDATEISESAQTLTAFAAGERPWLWVYISKADIDKIYNDGLRTVHVAYASYMSTDVSFYPNPEEKARNERLKSLGIMVGDENGNFNPYQLLTRAELVKIAIYMSNPDFMESVDLNRQSFTDVDAAHWSYPYVEYAAQKGMINGYEEGTFLPDRDVTIQETAKIIVSILGYAPQAESNGTYPQGYLRTADKLGLTKGITIGFDHSILRTEVADMILSALDTPLMVQAPDGSFVVCDGSITDYPMQTLATRNFASY